MTVTRDGDHFMTQATAPGQRPVEIFPENDHQFFAKIVNAEITFVTDASGRATELILHQDGADHHAMRIGHTK
jgi:D-alanyl-D-alanine-carboxypeptidase/D-alanyl-D-alanine-endopeptidase